MLKNFKPRLYQQTILGTAVNNNTLAVLPTGLGKTALAFLLTVQRLTKYPESKILLLAPTKPLCEQHLKTYREVLNIESEKIVLFTGSVSPKERADLWQDAKIIVSTPQGLENDLINRRINFQDVSLLIVDEAHHAVGDYSYVWLAEQYDKLAKNQLILALTASPGATLDKIKEICDNLRIEKVEVRTEKDPDVKPYVKETKINWMELKFPEELKKLHSELKTTVKKKLTAIKSFGYITNSNLNKGQILKLQGMLQHKLAKEGTDFDLMKSLSLIAEALKVEHALELLECQGIQPLHSYLDRLWQESAHTKIKAVKNLVRDLNFRNAYILCQSAVKRKVEYPKLKLLNETVMGELNKNNNIKLIIFTNYRDSAQEVCKHLESLAVKHELFVGQAKKNGIGLTQKKQKEVLDRFRIGEFNVLVATSVAEEGLDIPKVDKVIFYEPTASAIRNIQRRGRTGRLEEGEVMVMYMKGTRDEAYRWAAHYKEKNMYKTLEQLKRSVKNLDSTFASAEKMLVKESNNKEAKIEQSKKDNKSLNDYVPEVQDLQNVVDQPIAILADHREKDNKVVKELINLNISVRTTQLTHADYIISGKVAVEMKKVPDFVNSLVDGRLIEQVKELKQNFARSILIIEGEGDIYAARNVHPNAIRGALSSIVLGFGVPIMYTKDPVDTAALLAVMAKREQHSDSKELSLHTNKPMSMKEQQEYLVSALPGIGLGTARTLLEHFGSIKNLVNASEDDIKELKGIGKITAEKLVKLFDESYVQKK